jgi:type IV pilus assembly protein PilY1
VQVRIDRDIPMNFPRAASRTDCSNASYCTWPEEAQNFANWYTYYRTRLYSAIGVTSASLSGLTAEKGLDSLRLGYGSINYFPEGANPYPNINPVLNSRLPSSMNIDGQPSNGALVRGVRPFQQLSSTPPSPGSNDRRQEVFDWLFSLRAISATPNREAIDSVGRYFQRSDDRGPWIRPATTNETRNWQTNEAASAHISCRRNFTILVTDGEWTRAPYVTGAPQQPLVENTDTQLNALASTGPRLTGLGNRSYQYAPADEPQWSTNASSAGGTLSDIAFYYWSRDLRPDLPNNVRPVDATDARQGNPAFWQHLVPYIVGYGISASMDTSSTRQAVIAAARGARTPISWPGVRLEDRATEIATIVTDRDSSPINCNYDSSTNPSGCGRVNDTLRAALAARGDFLSATDVSGLAAGIASAFTAIGQLTGSSTALTGRSGTVRQGDRLFQATFQTNVWSGRLQSFDAVAYYNALSGTALDAGVSQRFPAPASRNVLTSTALLGSGVAFPTGSADFTNLTAAQRAALGDDSFVPQWLRGDQSQDGAGYRKRAAGELLGDIVNSQPLYSHWTDHGYSAGHAPAGAGSNASTYPQFVRDNKQYRPARVFVGANDGMLHAFDASGTPSTNSNYLTESFAYVPRAVYGALSTLASPNYIHQYLVDGPVVEGDVFINGAWRSVIVGTTGAGPKGLFAIDVTQRTGITARSVAATDVLWDIAPALDTATSGTDDVGNIVQPGVIGSGRDGEWYYFVGNGFESTNDKAKLLAIRIRDGAIFPIGTDSVGGSNPSANNVSGQPNGLGGITPIYDGNRNVVAVYAGDRLGRLWKFDLSSTNRNDWASATGTTPLFTAAAADGTRQAISAAPRVVPHPLGGRMIVFGTGKVFENNDLLEMTVQAVYGVWEKNVNSPANVAKSALRELTLADITDSVTGKKYRQLQNTTALNWANDLGWFFNLSTGTAYGERVVASPTENFGFVNVTSFEPAANGDPCVGGGRSFFYRLDISGSFTRAPFNTGGLNNLDATIPRNTVVGAELEGPTISGVQTLLRPVDGTSAVSSSLTSTQTSALGGASQSAATNCNSAIGGGVGAVGNALATPTLNCPVAPLRIWRDLPRGPR